MAVRVGVVLPTFYGGSYADNDPALGKLVEFGQCAEREGFDGLWVLEHLVVAPPIYRTTWLEPLSVLSALSAVTSRVRLGTSILILPLRNPAILAKTVGTMDYLSGGRITLGVGVGWWDQEYEVCGVPKAERGRRMDENLDLLRTLFGSRPATYAGPTYQFKDISIEPLPVQQPRIPIWLGGGSAIGTAQRVYTPQTDRVLRRVAKYGDGWISRASISGELMVRDWRRILEYGEQFGRGASEFTFAHFNYVFLNSGSDLSEREAAKRFSKLSNLPFEEVRSQYLVGTRSQVLARLDRLVELGVQYFILAPTGFDYGIVDFLAEEVLGRF